MAISQLEVNEILDKKSNLLSANHHFNTTLAAGDCLAYYNSKDGMFYFIKIVTTPVISDGLVNISARGVRFKFSSTVHLTIYDIYKLGESYGLVNATPNALRQLGEDTHNIDVHDKIEYVEYFNTKTLAISDLLQNSSSSLMDDIGVNGNVVNTKLFTVIVGGTYAGGTSTPEGWINGVIGYPGADTFLMNGMARQLSYNLSANTN